MELLGNVTLVLRDHEVKLICDSRDEAMEIFELMEQLNSIDKPMWLLELSNSKENSCTD